ncbi:chromate transporter [Citrobacter sp. MNAZ 1397]|nr:chromate transporter [Kluyvera intermedia]MCL9672143.1 chromate transporter [Citrobacter sp. MNAZ 1397]
MMTTLFSLAFIFLQLSFLALGGGNAIIPELQRQVVDVHHWMTSREFSELFALAQAAPGPNMMITSLVGWRVAGIAGLLVSTVCQFIPSSLIVVACVTLWNKNTDEKMKRVLNHALVPLTVGLVISGGALVAGAVVHNALQFATIAVCIVLFLKTRLSPLILLAAGGIVGLVAALYGV